MSDRLVAPRLDGNADFRADSVSAGNEHRFSKTGRHAEHPTESAKPSDGVFSMRRGYQLGDSRLCFVRRGNIDTRTPVMERAAAHAGSSSSNVVSSRSWRTRASTSLRVRFINRSIENFSTANDPSADPYITARRMLASLKSPVRARYPMKPPANESPAPVGSNTLSSGNAGAKKTLSLPNISAP